MQESHNRSQNYKEESAELSQTIVNRLRRIIHWSGKAEYKICDECGISRSHIRQYWNRGQVPTGPVIVRICKTFNVSADWLLGLSDEGGPAEPAPVSPQPKPKTPAKAREMAEV